MRDEIYQVEVKDSIAIFEFISEGPKGFIRKRVHYQETGQKNLYNLAFGDINMDTGDFDDKVISNNNDTKKVLATVAATVFAFMDEYPDAFIHAKGSTLARTRLYRIWISNNLEDINTKFKVYGLLSDNNWVEYEKNNNYSAFLIKNK